MSSILLATLPHLFIILGISIYKANQESFWLPFTIIVMSGLTAAYGFAKTAHPLFSSIY